MGNQYTGSNTGKAGLNVKKTDNTVDVFGVSQIQLDSNLTLTNNGGGSVTIQSSGGGGASGVTELSFGTTGFLPNSATTGSITMTGTLNVASGGTGATSLTDGGILLGSGTSAITATAQPTDGQLLIGSTGIDPVLATLTDGAGITITEGAGTITVASSITQSTGANPTATVSGTAVNGFASTFMRSDGAPALADTAVTAGSYTNTSLTVDAQGRLTAASSGTAPATGTGVANQVAFWNGATTLTGEAGLTWNPTGGSERLTVTGSSASDMLRIVSTNTGTGTAPDIAFVRDRTYTAGLDLGIVLFKGPDAADAEHTYAWIQADAKDGTVGNEKGQMDFRVGDGTGGNGFPLRLSDTGAHFNVVNATGLDVRMDSASTDNAFLLDASENDILTQVPFRNEIEIQSTDGGAAVAPDLKLYRNSASPAANDVLGQVLFSGEDSASAKIDYASITGFIVDASAGGHDGAIVFNCVRNGTSSPYFEIGQLTAGVRAMTVNPNGLDNDFIVETINQPLAFKIDGSADSASMNIPLTINQQTTGTAGLTLQIDDNGDTASPDIKLFHNSTSPATNDDLGHIHFQGKNSAAATVSYADIYTDILDPTDTTEAGRIFFRVRTATNSGNLTDMMSIRGDGNPSIVINDSGRADVDFRVETDNQNTAFFIDASADNAQFDVPLNLAGSINSYAGSAPTDGQLLIGDTASGLFDKGTLTSTGGTVTITNGAGTINLEAAGGGGGTPAGSDTEVQFNNAGAFGANSGLTYNNTTTPPLLSIGQTLGGVATQLKQNAGKTDTSPPFTVTPGGTITSTQSEISLGFNGGIALANEIHGIKLQPTDYQVKTGKTTTQSFGQTQNTIIGLGGGAQVVDCYPSQGGLIVVIGAATAITVNLTLGQFAAPLPSYDSGALPFQTPSPANTSNLPGYGTWQIGDQVTVLANLGVGLTPNITVRSYNSVQNGSLGVPSTAATSAPADDPSVATKINGVLSDTASGGGKAINTNFTAMTFILCADQTTTLGVAWVAIG